MKGTIPNFFIEFEVFSSEFLENLELTNYPTKQEVFKLSVTNAVL